MNKDIAASSKQPTRLGSWRTIRVFISSTFRDMHAERDHLVRTVFPELKEMCRPLRVQLIDVDLRWGVSEADAEGGKALDICLDEIDTCRPYFLGLLGHRYGFIPPGHPHSITAEEIYHGVLHTDIPKQMLDLNKIIAGKLEDKSISQQELDCLKKSYLLDTDRRKYLLRDNLSPKEKDVLCSIFQRYSIYQKDRSYFFFRSESFSRLLAGDHPDDFIETEALQQLQNLKTEIREAKLPVFEYDNLEKFGQLVRDTLWAKIETEAKEAVVEKDWLEQEAELHELFMADRTRRFVGRRELLERMHAFSETGDTPPLLVISGEPGCGKSALMARFTEETIQRHPDWLIIPHFVGASSTSTNLRRMLRRFCTALNRALGSTEEVSEDIKELVKLFPELLAKAGRNRPLLMVIDAVNQMEKGDNAHSMSWLPQTLPANVRFVISTLAGEADNALLARVAKPQVEQVRGLTGPEIRELVKAYLAEIRHEFPNALVEAEFFAKVAGGNPLYILVALEELRVFGKFEELEKRIRKLPDNVPDLFEQVLERIESDFNLALIRECLAFMACGRQGMTAEELQTLLKHHASEPSHEEEPIKLPDLVWRRLYRSFSAYLFERSGVIDFFHGQLKEAVGKRYLTNESDRKAAHKTIADYLEKRWREPYLRALDELPHQRTRALDWSGLERILCDLKFIEAKAAAKMAYDLVADYNAALSTKGFPTQTNIRDFARFVRTQSHVLSANPALTFQQAINEPDKTLQAQAAEQILAAGQETRPFFRWINKPQAVSACLMTLTGHSAAVTACGFSRDGSRIVSASDDKTLKLWDATTGKRLATLTGLKSRVSTCSFSPDGSRIVSASKIDKALKLWDATTGRELDTLAGNDYNVEAYAFSPDGSRLTSASKNGSLKLWDIATGKELANMPGHEGGINACTFSPDGSRIISVSYGSIKHWDATTGEELATLTGHSDRVSACAFSADSSRLVSALEDNSTIKIWDTATGKELAILTGHKSPVFACSFSPDGSRIISLSYMTLKLWDAATGKELAPLTGDSGNVARFAFSPDGSRLALASWDRELKLWDTATGRELATLTDHRNERVDDFAFSPDGLRIVGVFHMNLQLWDAATGKELAILAGHSDYVKDFAFSPDGSRILSASYDKTLKLWDLAMATEPTTLTGYVERVSVCAFSPEGSRIVSVSEPARILFEYILFSEGENHVLKLWDTATGKELATLTGHKNRVNACAFSPDGLRIVSASEDETLKIWDTTTGRELVTLENHSEGVIGIEESRGVRACGYSPDGSRIVSISDCEGLVLWDAATGERVGGIWTGHYGGVNAYAFFPDGSRLVSAGGGDLTIKFWDTASGKELAKMTDYEGNVYASTFSPDGSRIVSVSNKVLIIRDATTGRKLATLTGHKDKVTSYAYSPDGSYIVSASRDRMVKLWDAITGKEIGGFWLNGIGNCLCWSRDGQLAVGNDSSPILLLQPNNLIGEPVTTAWRNSLHKSIFHKIQKNDLGMGCPFCRTWSTIEESNLGKVISCSRCGKSLKLNPFTINADWHPIAEAWKKK